jgi:hypothetical protein
MRYRCGRSSRWGTVSTMGILFLPELWDNRGRRGRPTWMNFQFLQHVKKTRDEAIAHLELSDTSKDTVC